MANQSLILSWRQRWNRSLLQFLRRRVRTTVDIEDLAQETYMRLLRARHLTDVRNPQAYILRVASHVLTEWRDRRLPQDPLTAVDEAFLVTPDEAEGVLEAQLTQARLDEVLAQAPPATRAVLLLRFRDDCSQKEIVEKLGMTDRQVRRHLIKGYEFLRQSFRGLNGVHLNE
jgi:RNA polymerase sigma factor (sigma-70 family)